MPVRRRSPPQNAPRPAACLLAAALSAVAASCGGDDARPACLATVDIEACAPLYPAEFPIIFREVLAPTCGAAGVGCHEQAIRADGVMFGSESDAYQGLLGLGRWSQARVVPGDAACSELVVRLDSTGHEWSMPPGAPLDPRARCSIRRWIAAGAAAAPAP